MAAGGATGLRLEAQDHVAAPPPDSLYASEINRLLDKLILTQEELDRQSEPTGQSEGDGPVLVALGGPSQDAGGCEAVSGKGFSKDVDPGGLPGCGRAL